MVAGAAMNFLLGFLIVLLLDAPSSGFHAPVHHLLFRGLPLRGDLPGGRPLLPHRRRAIYFALQRETYLARGGDDMDVGRRAGRAEAHPEGPAHDVLDYEENGQTVRRYGFRLEQIDFRPQRHAALFWYQALVFVRNGAPGAPGSCHRGVELSDMAGVVGIVELMNETGKSAGDRVRRREERAVSGGLYRRESGGDESDDPSRRWTGGG
jgi:hypothetical protein